MDIYELNKLVLPHQNISMNVESACRSVEVMRGLGPMESMHNKDQLWLICLYDTDIYFIINVP